MKQPTQEDFKAHALTISIRHSMPGTVAPIAEGIALGYRMAVEQFCEDVARNTKELREHRESNNAPK
jgi:hypothetical protein